MEKVTVGLVPRCSANLSESLRKKKHDYLFFYRKKFDLQITFVNEVDTWHDMSHESYYTRICIFYMYISKYNRGCRLEN